MWIQRFIETARGTFKIFEKGEGEPLTVTHLYNEFDERGNAFANPFMNPFSFQTYIKKAFRKRRMK